MFSTPFGIPSTLKRHVSNWMAFHAIGVFLSGGRWNDLKTKYTQYGPSMSSPRSFGTVSPPGRSFFRPVWPEPAGSDVGIHGIINWTFVCYTIPPYMFEVWRYMWRFNNSFNQCANFYGKSPWKSWIKLASRKAAGKGSHDAQRTHMASKRSLPVL